MATQPPNNPFPGQQQQPPPETEPGNVPDEIVPGQGDIDNPSGVPSEEPGAPGRNSPIE